MTPAQQHSHTTSLSAALADCTEQIEFEVERAVSSFYSALENRGGGQPTPIHSMFLPGARITRVAREVVECLTVAELAMLRGATSTAGTLVEFAAKEVDALILAEDQTVLRWSIHAEQGAPAGSFTDANGRMLIELAKSGDRWLISSIVWADGRRCGGSPRLTTIDQHAAPSSGPDTIR